MHGGAAGSGGQAGNRNALKHGLRTARVAELRRRVRELVRDSRAMVELGRVAPEVVAGPNERVVVTGVPRGSGVGEER